MGGRRGLNWGNFLPSKLRKFSADWNKSLTRRKTYSRMLENVTELRGGKRFSISENLFSSSSPFWAFVRETLHSLQPERRSFTAISRLVVFHGQPTPLYNQPFSPCHFTWFVDIRSEIFFINITPHPLRLSSDGNGKVGVGAIKFYKGAVTPIEGRVSVLKILNILRDGRRSRSRVVAVARQGPPRVRRASRRKKFRPVNLWKSAGKKNFFC